MANLFKFEYTFQPKTEEKPLKTTFFINLESIQYIGDLMNEQTQQLVDHPCTIILLEGGNQVIVYLKREDVIAKLSGPAA